MKLIIKILLIIVFIQFLIFLYIKLVYEVNHSVSPYQDTNPNIQKQSEIISSSKELPQSSEYTLWDQKMIDKLNKKIQTFNNEIKTIVQVTIPIEKKENIVKKKEIIEISISKKIEKYAKEKLGQKYVWGATGPLTFDCSGFTQDVFLNTTGIKIPRVSRDQAKVGKYIEYANLKQGDMVFFDTEKKYSGKVNHVGIYLDNEKFIHASSAKKKIIITSFKKKPFYKKRFLWGRRVVENPS